MHKKIRVLQLQNRFSPTVTDLGEQIIQALPADIYEVSSAFLKGRPDGNSLKRHTGNQVFFDFSSKQLKGWRRCLAIRKIYRFCVQQQFDAVIVHRFKPTHIALLLAKRLGWKVCISITHGVGDYNQGYRQRLINRHQNARWQFVGVSKAVQDDFLKKCPGSKAIYINNAIDIHQARAIQLSRDQARSALGLPKKSFILGNIGRLVPVKGHTYLIKAMKLLASKYSDMLLVVIGGGEQEQALQQQIRRANLTQQVLLLGEKNDAVQYMRAFDLFVFQSLSEGLPLAVLEAMSAEIPVIGSDIPAIRPCIEHIGKLTVPASPESIASAIDDYRQLSPEARHQIGKNHYQKLCQDFSIQKFHQDYRRLLSPLENQDSQKKAEFQNQ